MDFFGTQYDNLHGCSQMEYTVIATDGLTLKTLKISIEV